MKISVITPMTTLLALLFLLPAVRLRADDQRMRRWKMNSSGWWSIVGRTRPVASPSKRPAGIPPAPASAQQQLLYGGSTPWTSYTSVRIDDATYVFGGPTERRAGLGAQYGTAVSAPTVKGNMISTTYRFDDVSVTQELSIVRGSSSRMLDTAGITYRINNEGKTAHQVGLRILLDTESGPNDGAPARVGAEVINTATLLPGDQLPNYWQAFDNLDNPTVISQGTYYGSDDTTRPDKVIFADWGTLADDTWEPPLDPKQGFIRKGEDEPDSATALFWNPVKCRSGAKSDLYHRLWHRVYQRAARFAAGRNYRPRGDHLCL